MQTAFKATYSDWKLVKTRQVVQIVFEVPLAEADSAYELLGGMPAPASERWFGIAALATEHARPQPVPDKPPAGAKQKKDWRDVPPSQQAGIRCDEAVFAAFLKESYPDEWHESQEAAECVRLICAVESRSMLNDGPHRVIWTQLNSQFEAWKALEHA
jgi:hypothetical protein